MKVIDHLRKSVEKITKYELRRVMTVLDVENVCKTLHIRIESVNEDMICGYCPDHIEYVGRLPSHPRWYLNMRTGITWCFTESRSSNLIEIARKILGYESVKETVDYLISGKALPTYIELKFIDQKYLEKEELIENATPENNNFLRNMKKLVDDGFMGREGYDFFWNDDINPDSLFEHKIIECQSGYYKNRVIIPFYHDETGVLCGYIAVSTQDRKTWCRKMTKQCLEDDDDVDYTILSQIYRHFDSKFTKVMYCKNSSTKNHLYGLWNLIRKNDHLETAILVEGERDVVKLQQEGFNALGIHGVYISTGKIQLLKKYGVRKVYIALDGDEAGQNAATNLLEKIKSEFDFVKILDIPEGKDPKKFTKEEFTKLIEKTNEGISINDNKPIQKYQSKRRQSKELSY